ncbi:MAG: hypothetical protein PVI26_10430 [Chitinispirillia bacterium]|jgi:hypothetical protein
MSAKKRVFMHFTAVLIICVFTGNTVPISKELPDLNTRNFLFDIVDPDEKHFVKRIAEYGKKDAFLRLRSGKAIPQSGYILSYTSEKELAAGNYSVHKKIEALIDTFHITPNNSKRNNRKKEIKIVVVYSINEVVTLLNPDVRAAFTTNSSVITKGNIYIDGRDYDPEGAFVVGDGVYGIKSSGLVALSKKTRIGGKGLNPTFKAYTNVIDNKNSIGNYYSSPEDVLGLPPNSLNKYKTNELPPLPFYGIVYYSPDGEFECPDLESSSGVLICHNDEKTAIIKNFNGRFRGLVICDRFDQMTKGSEILGAVVALGDNGEDNILGNSNNSIRYSSQILTNLNNFVKIVSDTTIDIFSCERLP